MIEFCFDGFAYTSKRMTGYFDTMKTRQLVYGMRVDAFPVCGRCLMIVTLSI